VVQHLTYQRLPSFLQQATQMNAQQTHTFGQQLGVFLEYIVVVLLLELFGFMTVEEWELWRREESKKNLVRAIKLKELRKVNQQMI